MKFYNFALTVCILSVVVTMRSPATAADWPQFRGPGGLGISGDAICRSVE